MSLTNPIILAVLAFVIASGGGYYGGYYVHKVDDGDQPKVCHNFDQQVHTVERVIDGDTVVLEDKSRVRLLGIDAPENGECYAGESTQALKKLVLGKEVILQKGSTAVDEHGRFLRYIFIYNDEADKDNPFVNDLLIKQGAAIPYLLAANRRYESLLNNSYAKAKTKKVGMHGACKDDIDLIAQPSAKCNIKGNISRNTGKKIYYLPGCLNYTKIIMRRSEGDQYFCTEAKAEKANFKKSGTCK